MTGGGETDKKLNSSTHFSFENTLFQVEGSRFALTGPDRIPALWMNVGKHEVSIPLIRFVRNLRSPRETRPAERLNRSPRV